MLELAESKDEMPPKILRDISKEAGGLAQVQAVLRDVAGILLYVFVVILTFDAAFTVVRRCRMIMDDSAPDFPLPVASLENWRL